MVIERAKRAIRERERRRTASYAERGRYGIAPPPVMSQDAMPPSRDTPESVFIAACAVCAALRFTAFSDERADYLLMRQETAIVTAREVLPTSRQRRKSVCRRVTEKHVEPAAMRDILFSAHPRLRRQQPYGAPRVLPATLTASGVKKDAPAREIVLCLLRSAPARAHHSPPPTELKFMLSAPAPVLAPAPARPVRPVSTAIAATPNHPSPPKDAMREVAGRI